MKKTRDIINEIEEELNKDIVEVIKNLNYNSLVPAHCA
jgi:hypothetical protein